MWLRLRLLATLATTQVREMFSSAANGWNRFWFTPADPTTLCVIRILAGLMLFYSHAVWTLDLSAFFGEQSWLSREVIAAATRDSYQWSLLSLCRSPAVLWSVHLIALTSFFLLTIGLWTRIASAIAFVMTVSYAYRSPAALFGLDQINGLLSLYLMVGPCGACYSWDALRARRRGCSLNQLSVTANLAIRLMQCHLCVVYLFAGLSKLQGPTWWSGLAFWGGIANQEYQTLDLTWLADYPLLIAAMTHATLAWELSYCVLIWNRWARPLMLLGAIVVHLGIVVALGMPTFGLVMLIANVSFISPQLVRMLVSGCGTPSVELGSAVRTVRQVSS